MGSAIIIGAKDITDSSKILAHTTYGSANSVASRNSDGNTQQ